MSQVWYCEHKHVCYVVTHVWPDTSQLWYCEHKHVGYIVTHVWPDTSQITMKVIIIKIDKQPD